MTGRTSVDRELLAVLVCLSPLGERGYQYVDQARREFSYREMLDSQAWSSGERQLIIAAGALWNRSEGLDLGYVAGLDRRFFQAFIDALAVCRGADFRSDWQAAQLWTQL